ncbi:hypothetical protein GCM10020218_047840 [Dactylosporangium vinaceum]
MAGSASAHVVSRTSIIGSTAIITAPSGHRSPAWPPSPAGASLPTGPARRGPDRRHLHMHRKNIGRRTDVIKIGDVIASGVADEGWGR